VASPDEESAVIDPDETHPPDGTVRRPSWLARMRLGRFRPGVFVKRHHFRITLSFLVAAFFLVLFWNTMVVPIYAGHEGVYWSRFFGGTRDKRLMEGTHLKFPWDDITVYDVRILAARENTVVLTSDGMAITVEYVAQYRAEARELPRLHRDLGPEYATKIVLPMVISSLRQILGNYRADEIYARDELSLLAEIDGRIRERIESFPVHFEAVLLLRLDLPKMMAEGIVEKLLQEQKVLAYAFRIRAEEQERQRKGIEAQGIAEFERASGISMLRWRGLDVTAELAKSPNAKVIVVGTGPNGLPLILNAP
jgi:regulator of protease activity HflC (stomatin/prohibitin superfamily)